MSKVIQRLLFGLIILCGNSVFSQQCGVIYVSPGGASSGAAGTKAAPASLQYALTLAGGNPSLLYLRSGTYNLSNTINLVSNVRIEGGFNALWEKTNGAETILIKDFTNPQPNPARLVAIQGIGLNNFELHDLTVKTANAVGSGISTYCIYLSGCSNYELVRVKTQSGSASNGNAGGQGSNGLPGAAGAAGQNGDEDGACCTSGGTGASGSFAGSNPGANGGNGGAQGTYVFPLGGSAPPGSPGNAAPGTGGGSPGLGGIGVDDRLFSLVSCPRTTLNDGTAGTDGLPGLDGGNGGNGTDGFSAGYYQPANGINGVDGTNGFGGGGGGGGGSQGFVFYGLFISNSNGAGAGGGGGGEGGQGSLGGLGGTGGGGSFGLFVWNNGAGGVVRDCYINSGNYGIGGLGGPGGYGGAGGNAGAGGGQLNCDIGAGGNGGKGGKGGNGGSGGKGSDGLSIDLYQDPSGTPLNILNINSIQQPVVKVEYSGCTNTPVVFTTNQTGTIQWFFGANSSPASAYGQTATAYYTATGEKTFTMVWNGIPYTFTEFLNIYNNSTPSLPQILSSDSLLCEGAAGTYTSSIVADSYEWQVTGGPNNINQQFAGVALQSLSAFVFTDAGDYTVYLQTVDNCCGRSFKDSFFVHVDSIFAPLLSIQSSGNTNTVTVCQGTSVIYTAAAANAGLTPTYQWQLNGANIGSNSPTYVNASPSSGDLVNCTVTSSLGCSTGQTANSNTITVNVIGTPQVSCSADSFYTYNPTFFTATVTSGGLAPFTYSWDFGNSSFGAGSQVATVYSAAGNYNVQVDVTDSNGCVGTCNLLVQINNFLKADFSVNKFNGCAPLDVQFTNESVNALTYLWNFGDGTNSNAVNPPHIYQSPGTYNVTLYAFSASGTLTASVNNQIVVFPSPVANFWQYPTGTASVGDTVYFADNSFDAWTWQWNFGDPISGALNTSNIQNPLHYYSTNNYYTVNLLVTNNYGCRDSINKTDFVFVNVGLNESNLEDVAVFPNPFYNDLFIQFKESNIENLKIELFDVNGKIIPIETNKIIGINGQLKIPEISAGVYFLKVRSNNFSKIFKLIKSANNN